MHPHHLLGPKQELRIDFRRVWRHAELWVVHVSSDLRRQRCECLRHANDLHPDDKAWLDARSPGAGAAPPRDDEADLAEILAGAMASWERRHGGSA